MCKSLRRELQMYFCRPLPRTSREETVNIMLHYDPFSMKELKDALKKAKTKKSSGPDRITGEMLKHFGACSKAVLLQIFNHSWMKEGSTHSLERGRDYTSAKERQRQKEPT